MTTSNDEDAEVAYTFIIHTGSNLPDQKSTKKWDDGTMILKINPGSDTTESKDLRVKDHFPTMTEGDVRIDFWLPSAIGVPKLLKVDLESNMLEIIKDALYIREITIIYNRASYRFPIKNYLYPHSPVHNPTEPKMGCPPHILVREGAGTLRHRETEDFIVRARDEDRAIMQSMIKWNDAEVNSTGLLFPGYLGVMDYDKLPRILKFREATLDNFMDLRSSGRKEVKINMLQNMGGKVFGTYKEERFESFEQFYLYLKYKGDELGWDKEIVYEAMKVAKIFRQDEEFGRQILSGCNAWMIKKVISLEVRWAAGTVPMYTLEGKSVEQVLEEGRLFEVSYDDLIDIPHGGGLSKMLTGTSQTWYTVLADCLLYQRDDGKLVPILIRLENRNDGEPETWWSPPEPENTDLNHPAHLAWLWAKMWFKCAEASCNFVITHFARAHATSEIFAVAVYRTLPNAHPIFRLLQPHIIGVIPINVQGRAVLINPNKNAFACVVSAGDHLGKVFHNHFKNFSYENLILPDDVKKRGVEDIPEYLLRDDFLAHWAIIQEYVEEIVNLTYLTDADVAKDEELQDLFKEIVDFGFRGFPNGGGFPRVVSDRYKLTEYLTAIIVNISTFHAAANFQVLTSCGFVPNMPSCLSIPPPKQHDNITMELIVESLPVREIAFLALNIVYVLGQFSPIDCFFLEDAAANKRGIIGENMIVAPEQEACIHRLVEKMRQLKEKIDARNVGRYLKYDVLSPVNIPLATAT